MACLTPFYIKNPRAHLPNQERHIPVPCNKCADCFARRTSAWSFRMMQHTKIADTSIFVTFTYAQPPLSPNGFPTLDKKDWQNFTKRLRNLYRYRGVNLDTGKLKWFYDKVPQIRYYCAGEYGDTYHRPHYHAILYNTTAEACERAWRAGGQRFGHTFTGNLSYASAGYCAKYINKGTWRKRHNRDDRQPHFSLMSKRLGANYLSPAIVGYHRYDITRNYVTLDGGQKIPLPRYYRDKIFTDQDKLRQSVYVRADNDKREAEKLAKYVLLYGTQDGYDRNKHEAVRAAIDRFHKLTQKRVDV